MVRGEVGGVGVPRRLPRVRPVGGDQCRIQVPLERQRPLPRQGEEYELQMNCGLQAFHK